MKLRCRLPSLLVAVASVLAVFGVLSPEPLAAGEAAGKGAVSLIDRPVMFNTPEADAICSALQVFPPNHPLNLSVEDWPEHPNSKATVTVLVPLAQKQPLG